MLNEETRVQLVQPDADSILFWYVRAGLPQVAVYILIHNLQVAVHFDISRFDSAPFGSGSFGSSFGS